MTETRWRVPVAAMDGTDLDRWQVTIGPRWYSVASFAVDHSGDETYYLLTGLEERFLFPSELFAYRSRGGRQIDVGIGASVALALRAPGSSKFTDACEAVVWGIDLGSDGVTIILAAKVPVRLQEVQREMPVAGTGP